MLIYKEVRYKLHKISKYVIVLLLLFSSGTVYQTLYQPKVFVAAFSILFIAFVLTGSLKVGFHSISILLFLLACVVMSSIINIDTNVKSLWDIMLPLVIGFLASCVMERDEFYKSLLNIMLFFSVLSLSLTVISMMNPQFILRFPDTGYRGFTTFYGLHTFMGIYPTQVDRNSGPFREPGVFEIYLCFALIVLLFSKVKIGHRLLKTALLMFAIASTVSSTGIAAMMAIMVGYLFYRPSFDQRFSRFMKVVLFVGIILAIAAVLTNGRILFDKLNPASQSYASYSMRHEGTISDLMKWLSSPVFGVGLLKYEKNGMGSANSITYALAMYGIFFTFTEVYLFWKYIKNTITRQEGRFTRIFIGIALIVIFYTQSAIFFPFIQAMLFYEAKAPAVDNNAIMRSGYGENSYY